MNHNELWRELLQAVVQKIGQDRGQIVRCLKLLEPHEVWHRAAEPCNSVGNLVLHLTGNVRQWILCGLGGEPFERDRPAEFSERGPRPIEPLVAAFEQTVRRAIEIIAALSAESLGIRRRIQGYDVSTLVAVFHVAEHFSFHTGQIVHMTKALKNVDLSLYDEQGRRVGTGDQPW
jgi:uncharacterized damage-inducible protein DinB